MNINYMIDKINIKFLPEEISKYLHDNSVKKYHHLRSFYAGLLGLINEDIKESYLNRILKYLSSDKESTINIIEDFNNDIYNEELLNFVNELVELIDNIEGKEKFYEKLNSSLNRIFFDFKEFVDIKNAHNEKNYNLFIFLLLKHSFKMYRFNTPAITAKRIYDEALTLYYDSPRRKKMIEKSCELGSEQATILYASYIYEKKPDEAISFFLKLKTNPSSLWEIAFSIEQNRVSNEQVTKIKYELRDFLVEDEFTEHLSLGTKYYTKNVLTAIKLYNYIEKKYNFTKAINSIGKLLINGIVLYDKDNKKSIMIGKQYLNKAIKLGNLPSIVNMGLYLYKNTSDPDYDEYIIKNYLKIARDYEDVRGTRYYGEIMMKEGNIDEAINCYKFAASMKDEIACYYLGKHYELKSNYAESIKYYKEAISFQNYDAVYELANLYYSLSDINKDDTYNGMAKMLVEFYFEKLDTENQKKCKRFLEK